MTYKCSHTFLIQFQFCLAIMSWRMSLIILDSLPGSVAGTSFISVTITLFLPSAGFQVMGQARKQPQPVVSRGPTYAADGLEKYSGIQVSCYTIFISLFACKRLSSGGMIARLHHGRLQLGDQKSRNADAKTSTASVIEAHCCCM